MATVQASRASRFLSFIDPFIVALICAAALGFLLPAHGAAAPAVAYLTKASIALLFFLQGVRLQRAAVVAGIRHWRLQLLTLACTFVLFPTVGLALHGSARALLDDSLWLGVLYLCTLPSTVQSSIAFTSIAKGNVAAAICAATVSNLLGIVLTPLLVAALLNLHGKGSPLDQIESIVMQLLVPFIAGQIASRWLRPWAMRHGRLLTVTDRGSIILVVYSAFGAAVQAGVWSGLSWDDIVRILAISAVLLGVALFVSRTASRLAGFSREDQIAVVFCGSKKSLATGVPMANVLFPAATVGLVILPVMIFHQIQLIVCAALARRYAALAPAVAPESGPPATERLTLPVRPRETRAGSRGAPMKIAELFKVEGYGVVVTGGASGLGLGFTEALATNGARVTMLDIDEKRLAAETERLRKAGQDVRGAVVDVRDHAALEREIAEAAALYGRLDVVFANAGIDSGPGFIGQWVGHQRTRNPEGEIENYTDERWQKVIDINLTGVFATCRAAARHMKPRRSGRIIITTSLAALKNEAVIGSAYMAAKAGAAHFMRNLALELATYDITVNAIAPGFFVTNIGGGHAHDPATQEAVARSVPLHRVGWPKDMAGLALFLASPASDYLTGQQIVIDGGWGLGEVD